MLRTKVLLVDDDEAFLSATAKRLAHRGMDVLTARSGEEGLEKLEDDPGVDVVILDVKMPEMDGIETLRRIKAEHPLVEVIMLTGHATFESAGDGMKLGAFDYLMKPCDIDDLTAGAEEAKKRRRSHLARILERAGKDARGKRAR